MFDQVKQRVAQLFDIVRWDRGGHPNRDALGAIGQQIWKRGGQYDRFAVLAVVGVAKVDRIFVNATEQPLGDLGQARLGVAHGGRVIAIDIAEISLAVDQGIPLGEFLGQPNHGVIDRGVAMGVELTHDVANHAGRFLERLVRR